MQNRKRDSDSREVERMKYIKSIVVLVAFLMMLAIGPKPKSIAAIMPEIPECDCQDSGLWGVTTWDPEEEEFVCELNPCYIIMSRSTQHLERQLKNV